jgi:phosphoserine aminotransferase
MKVFNFAAGPSIIPREVLETARAEFLDWRGTGLSVLELPFTGPEFRAILDEAAADLSELLAIPRGYRVLFLQGGAYGHFAMVPMNLLRGRSAADYVESGHWSKRAIAEARRYCRVAVSASGAASGFTRLPVLDGWRPDPEAAYCHVTTNETAEGLQFRQIPETGDIPLVADMTSDFLTRPVNVARFGLIYASAQKNVGPAGLTVVILREDLLGGALPQTPAVFDYTRQAEACSKVNTPPTYAIYLAGLVFKWLKAQGGLKTAQRESAIKSAKLYGAIDAGDFYGTAVPPEDRSLVTVCFGLAESSLESSFLAEAQAAGLLNLKGHPASGGLRASLYNAMPQEGVDALVDFMEGFARSHRHNARGG